MSYYDIKRISFSTLKEILRSPAHYRYACDNPPEPTPAMVFGQAVHTALLEPQKYTDRFVEGISKGRTKESKAAYEEFAAANAGKIILTSEQNAAVEGIKKAVAEHVEATRLIATGAKEYAILWTLDGLDYKAKLDVIGDGYILDVKTCHDASAQAAARTTVDRMYHLQAAIYQEAAQSEGREIERYYLLYVEKDPPYGVALYDLRNEWMEIGHTLLRQAREILKWCLDNQKWPSYQPFGKSEILSPPKWAWHIL